MASLSPLVFKKDESFARPVLIQDYTIKLTKTGAEYIEGTMQAGNTFTFKAWGSSAAFATLKAYNFKGEVAQVAGSFDLYNNIQSTVLDSVVSTEGYSPYDFLKVKYDRMAYLNALKDLVAKSCSEKGTALLNKMLFSNEELINSFTLEFAAKSHHDNCLSGLLAHTYKVTYLLSVVLSMYPMLTCDETDKSKQDTDKKDLFVIGVVLHDIGKVIEMHMGTYTDESVVTHAILGMDLLYKFKADIEATYSGLWFRYLQSILAQHHGEWGERPRTVYSFIIHKVDELDAKSTELSSKLEEAPIDSAIPLDGYYLKF